ncbi:holliday junction resolvase-like protein [Caldisphaera lagunensis DSM 15908]|uniref:Holliday junction resolvase-like protein n=1 Tax=Caldisphaera lagunensis (strain DSM 15908 / JCM 11604 / ANMR 0165 / IC-154) TaxID=1056495 RepID=L0AB69_CALLD|nr:Holliday junction resolvase-like protein [Caldisphaera lagunensis]AFZ71106.1 holliday junction resolvase-like protein [Caldisphaera lagunensis DSM 15908]
MSILIYALISIILIELIVILYLYISNWRKSVKIDSIKSNIENLANEKAKVIAMESIEKARKEAVQQSKAVITGKVYEQFAPYLPNFKHNPKEARFIGSPIDYIVFDGIENNDVKAIYFVEIKSGKSNLTNREESIKKAVEKKAVYFETIYIDDKNNS